MTFETFIYVLGAATFALAVPTAAFAIVALIERPRRRHSVYNRFGRRF